MKFSLRLGVLVVGTALLTTTSLADGVVLVAPSNYAQAVTAASTPTLVQQLQAKLAYQLEELAEYGPQSYYGPASKRTAKHLAKAQAAAAAGNPLAPIQLEGGGVVPLSNWSGNYTDGGYVHPTTLVALAASALAAVVATGGPAAQTPNTSIPSANPDTGGVSQNLYGGATPLSLSKSASLAAAAAGEGGTSANPDTGGVSANPDSGPI